MQKKELNKSVSPRAPAVTSKKKGNKVGFDLPKSKEPGTSKKRSEIKGQKINLKVSTPGFQSRQEKLTNSNPSLTSNDDLLKNNSLPKTPNRNMSNVKQTITVDGGMGLPWWPAETAI